MGGVRLSQRMILAAGLLKGDEFDNSGAAVRSAKEADHNLIPGWQIIPAILGPVEFGSFTLKPRSRNPGSVSWRYEKTQSTQNRFGLPNPGAQAAALFLSQRKRLLPKEYGINIAVTPEAQDIDVQEQDLLESLTYFLESSLHPSWFTLNLSCPNTDEDAQAYQLEANARQLCAGFLNRLRAWKLEIPLWVKVSPGLSDKQYCALMRVFDELGVKAVIATNTLAQPSPDDENVQAGVGGGALRSAALQAVRQLLAEKQRNDYAVDVIACGGILDGASLGKYEALGVKAAQYWSALVYRGPFAAALIENELARNGYQYETVQRESLA